MADDEINVIERKPSGCPLDPVLNFLALKWLVHIVWFLGRKESSTLRRAATAVTGSRLRQGPVRSPQAA